MLSAPGTQSCSGNIQQLCGLQLIPVGVLQHERNYESFHQFLRVIIDGFGTSKQTIWFAPRDLVHVI